MSQIDRLLPQSRPTLAESLRQRLVQRLTEGTDEGAAIWTPLVGPQTMAYLSEADELFYGGAGGGGKTDLLLGLSATQHRHSIIFRRESTRLKGMVERSKEVFGPGERGHQNRYNETMHTWRLSDRRVIEFGYVQYEDDKENYRGRPHDFYGWDEVTEFSEGIFRFVNAWNRTTRKGQRCRIVAASNPPSSTEGEWVIRYWAPWLDGQHPHPAEPGELRWFVTIDGKDEEVEASTPFEHKGEMIRPRSRTFIPAKLTDNPYLMETGYAAVLQGLPEPLRSQMLYGDFTVGVEDDPWQVIPTAWVRAAQARWTKDGMPKAKDEKTGEEKPLPQSAVGVDVARGGRDKTVLSRRFGTWYAPLEKHPGSATPDGPAVAALVMAALVAGGYANIDGIGVGASVYDQCRQHKMNVNSVIFSEAATERDKSGQLGFANKRAQAYWKFREALDPVTGDSLALPPDPELLSDLCAPKWAMRLRGIQVEEKEEIIKRLGRSPDCGDGVVLAAMQGPILPFSWMKDPRG